MCVCARVCVHAHACMHACVSLSVCVRERERESMHVRIEREREYACERVEQDRERESVCACKVNCTSVYCESVCVPTLHFLSPQCSFGT